MAQQTLFDTFQKIEEVPKVIEDVPKKESKVNISKEESITPVETQTTKITENTKQKLSKDEYAEKLRRSGLSEEEINKVISRYK